VNHIADPNDLVVGQAIFIPQAVLKTRDGDKNQAVTQRLNFLTVYPHPRPLMQRALLSMFKELGVGIVQATENSIASTVWIHNGVRYTFMVTLTETKGGTEMRLVCLVARAGDTSEIEIEQEAQSWIEQVFFHTLDQAIVRETTATNRK